jgi:DNA-binding response OmpR family regulator
MSVLIIEDNADAAESLANFLRIGCGYEVATARDGLMGLRMASEMHPDVIVCDVGLPKRNGLLVGEELSASLPCRALLICLTAYTDQVTEGLALDAGFDHFLAKPTDPFAIQDLIEAHAERLGKHVVAAGGVG